MPPPFAPITLPPLASNALTTFRFRLSFNGTVPPHAGAQPEEEPSANARVKTFWPVALATSTSDGVGIVMSMYGATRALPGVGGTSDVVVVEGGVVVVDVGVPPPHGTPLSL